MQQQDYQPSLYYTVQQKYNELCKDISINYMQEIDNNNTIDLYEYINDYLIYYDDQVTIMAYYLYHNTTEFNKPELFNDSIQEFYNDIVQDIESKGYKTEY